MPSEATPAEAGLYCGMIEPEECAIIRKLRHGYELTQRERENIAGKKPNPDALLRRAIERAALARRVLLAAGFTLLDVPPGREVYDDDPDVPAPFAFFGGHPGDWNDGLYDGLREALGCGWDTIAAELRAMLRQAVAVGPDDGWSDGVEAAADCEYRAWWPDDECPKPGSHDPWQKYGPSVKPGTRRIAFALPRPLMLGPGDDDYALAARCPLALPVADIVAVGNKVRWQPAALAALLEARRAAAGHRSGEHVPQTVTGLLLAGEVTALVGDTKIGKSTLAHQIAATIAAGSPDVLGYEIPEAMRGRMGVLLSGEGSVDAIHRRAFLFSQHGLCGDVFPAAKPMGGLVEALRDIKDIPNLGVVVVDPARVWMDGKEEDSDVVSRFLSILQDFAHGTRAAVLCIHHLKRLGARVALRTPVEVVRNLRGSQVWFDRPRALIGMLRKADGTAEIGVTHSSYESVIPKHTTRLRFDPDAEMFHRISSGSEAARARASTRPLAGDDADAIVGCIRRIRSEGAAVRKTGDRSLFTLKPAELTGWSRQRIEDAVQAAKSAGLLADDKMAGLTVPA